MHQVKRALELSWRALFLFACGAFILRLYILISANQLVDLPPNYISLNIQGFSEDVSFFILVLLVLFLPNIGLLKVSNKAGSVLMVVTVVLVLLLEYGLGKYFLTNFQPLGKELMLFDSSSIWYIIAPEIVQIPVVIWLILAIVLGFIIYGWVSIKIQFNRWKVIVFLILAVLSSLYHFVLKNSSHYDEIPKGFAVSKTAYFISKCYNHINVNQLSNDYPKGAVEMWQKDNISCRDTLYPFLKNYESNLSLVPYFDSIKVKPNFVFIIVESLSRKFSGPDRGEYSFTPFLDSLADHSLYWTNCLSTSERTYGVLPSIFAGAPSGVGRGFINLGERMPEFISLQHILHDNDYTNNFFFGGWLDFDHTSTFFNRMPMNHVLEQDQFGKGYKKMEEKSGQSWGYSDKDLFKKYFEYKDTDGPQCDVFMTLSMHSPFTSGNSPKYTNLVNEKLKELASVGENKFKKRPDVLRTVMFTDDAIKDFINNYKRTRNFKNTIFVITGDHNLGSLFQDKPLDKYHVPLIIYSPLLRESQVISDTVSHLDITPYVTGLMSQVDSFIVPKQVSFLATSSYSFFKDVAGDIKYMLFNNNFQKVDPDDEYVDAYEKLNHYISTNNRLYTADLLKYDFSKYYDMESSTSTIGIRSDDVSKDGKYSLKLDHTQQSSDSLRFELPKGVKSFYITTTFDFFSTSKIGDLSGLELVIDVFDESGQHISKHKEMCDYDFILPNCWNRVSTGKSVNAKLNHLKSDKKYFITYHLIAHRMDVYLDNMSINVKINP